MKTLFVAGMSRDDAYRRIEQLEAELAQRDRLLGHLQQQVTKLLNEVAKLKKKPARGRKRRKDREAKAKAKADSQKEDPPGPPERTPREEPERRKTSRAEVRCPTTSNATSRPIRSMRAPFSAARRRCWRLASPSSRSVAT